jgi:hypothetical protein
MDSYQIACHLEKIPYALRQDAVQALLRQEKEPKPARVMSPGETAAVSSLVASLRKQNSELMKSGDPDGIISINCRFIKRLLGRD